MKNFLSTSTDSITFVPFDIETTGFMADDVTTTLTLKLDDQYHAWVNGGDHAPNAGDLNADIREACNLPVTVYVADDEPDMFESVRKFLFDNIDSNSSLIVAYNGEKWKGGFDLKFLRTKAVKHGVTFPFKGYSYTDAIEVFKDKDRFNTTVPAVPKYNDTTKTELESIAEYAGVSTDGNKSDVYQRLKDANLDQDTFINWAAEHDEDIPTRAHGDLCAVHEVLVGGKDIDPFDDSEKAVTAYESGDFTELLLHNLADVQKTADLTEIMANHAPKYDYRPKVL